MPAVLAVVLSAVLFAAQRRLDFTPSEEGFLWYGAVAVAHGDVPLRDFYAYDPGRYYWAAAWAPLAGEGLFGLRLATAAFGAVGVFCGLLAARRAIRQPLWLILLAVALTLWLAPRHKLYEPAMQMAGVLAATALLEQPTVRRHLAAGATVGCGLFVGKNHALYLGAAVAVILLLQWWRGEDRAGAPRRWLACLGGIAIGAAPLAVMAVLLPGFARSYLDSFLFFVHAGRTNFPRPVPWPWRYPLSHMGLWPAIQTASIGFCFLLTVAFFAAGVVTVLTWRAERLRRYPLLAAAVLVGAAYTHYTFSRADVAHLASAAHALLLGLAALTAALAANGAAGAGTAGGKGSGLLRRSAAVAVALVLAAITAATALPNQLFYRLAGQPLTAHRIAGEDILLRPRTAQLLDWVERQAADLAPQAPILMAPNIPGLYTALGRRSPVWDIYPIWPAAGPIDDRMLAELRRNHVDWAIVDGAAATDGLADLDLPHTHPETWRYLTANFQPRATFPGAEPFHYMLLERK